jgi:type II secretory pathway pseudopilin PulG
MASAKSFFSSVRAAWRRDRGSRPRARGEAGFSLIETLISVGLLATVALSVAQMFVMATQANLNAKGQTSATLLAEQKMEQLRGLTWGFDTEGLGLPETDTTTNLTQDPPTNNGQGLNPSPANSLVTNVAGYHDFVDAYGAGLGSGGAVPAGTAFVRRWAVDPLPTNPNNTLVLQVQVTPISRDTVRNGVPRLRDEVRLVSVKTRKAR